MNISSDITEPLSRHPDVPVLEAAVLESKTKKLFWSCPRWRWQCWRKTAFLSH